MDKTIELQMQIRNNSTDLHSYAKELNDWEAEMKQKDKLLQKPIDTQDLPPVRSKRPRPQKEQKEIPVKPKAQNYSCDYSNWDKFDVDEACKDVDKSSSEESEDEEDVMAEAAAKAEEAKRKEREAAKVRGDKEKLKGNDLVKQEKWTEAIECYTRAINMFNEDAVYFANRGLCYLKKENWFDAEVDCSASLAINPNYVKAFQRRATAFAAQGKLVEAVADLSFVVKIEPKNRQAKQQIEKLQKELMSKKIENTKDENRIEKQELHMENIHNVKSDKRISKESQLALKNAEQPSTSKSKLSGEDRNMSDDEFQEVDWATGSCGDGSVLVHPIRKPPHLRSKKPLRRIQIQEVVCQESKRKSPHTMVHTHVNRNNVIQRELENVTKSLIQQDNALNEIDTKVKKELINSIQIENLTTTQINDTPSDKKEYLPYRNNRYCHKIPVEFDIPKTAMQFYNMWKLSKHDSYKRFELLLSVPGPNLAEFFRSSLESDILSEIFDILKEEFTTRGEEVWPYLHGISKIPRFTALILFLKPKYVTIFKDLFQYCELGYEATDKEIHELECIYEMS